MSDATLHQPRPGDERLLLTCLIVEELCAERVPAPVRLEAAIGPAGVRSLVVPLARRLVDRAWPDASVRVAARTSAAA